MYDDQAKFNVIVNKKISIKFIDAIDGILILFLTYYVFGICYPEKIEKTLEFIQK